MAAKSKSREPLPRKPKLSNDAEEKIRLRAYELYEQRGRLDGFAWTTGSKRRQRISERRSNGRSNKQRD
jgi:hypothetical protein